MSTGVTGSLAAGSCDSSDRSNSRLRHSRRRTNDVLTAAATAMLLLLGSAMDAVCIEGCRMENITQFVRHLAGTMSLMQAVVHWQKCPFKIPL